jgi:hypothetical protein
VISFLRRRILIMVAMERTLVVLLGLAACLGA